MKSQIFQNFILLCFDDIINMSRNKQTNKKYEENVSQYWHYWHYWSLNNSPRKLADTFQTNRTKDMKLCRLLVYKWKKVNHAKLLLFINRRSLLTTTLFTRLCVGRLKINLDTILGMHLSACYQKIGWQTKIHSKYIFTPQKIIIIYIFIYIYALLLFVTSPSMKSDNYHTVFAANNKHM